MQGLPPGPRAAPVAQMWQWVRDPLGFLDRCRAAHGRLFTLRSPNIGAIVVAADPEGVRQIFTAPPSTLHARPYNLILAPALGEHSLLLTDGAAHTRRKRLMAPAFHRRALSGYAAQIRQAAQRRIEDWADGAVVNLKSELEAASIEIICRVVFGVSDDALPQAAAVIQRLTHAFGPKMLYFPALRRDLGPWSPGGRLRRAMDDTHALLQSLIDARRGDPGSDDVLGMLMAARDEDGRGMPDDVLRDQLLTLLNAGHDTVTSAMCWAVHHLHQPGCAALPRAVGEARAADDDPLAWSRLPWLTACCEEALRVVPIIPSVGRAVVAPMALCGHSLPAGVRVMAPCYLSHRDPAQWDEPGAYRPERFLGKRASPFVFYPFGGGPRVCIGGAFAMMEMTIVLAALLRHAELTLEAPAAPPSRVSLTLIPRGGVPVRVRKRA